MIAGIKPYPVYRDPGLVWLDRVPAHWSTRRMKFLFRQRRQRGFPREQLLAATQTKGVVRKQDYEARTVTATAGLENLQLVEVDDFVISLRSFQGGIEISHARGIISPAYTILTAARSESRGYFRHLFKSAVFIQSLRLFVTGIREGQTIDYERLGRAFMPLPPPEEQTAIVRFLDHVGGRIDRAIRAKRKVIALLQEQKQAIIECAVTQGVDPDVALRQAGTPWLSKVPAHWRMQPLKQLLVRVDYGTSESGRREGRVRMLTMGHIRDGKVWLPTSGCLPALPPGLTLERDDLLFNRTNSPELVGKVGLFCGEASDEVTFASYLVRLRVRAEHSPAWLCLLLNSGRFWAYARSQALVSLHQANLNPTRYVQLLLPVPASRDEEEAIVADARSRTRHLERRMAELDRETQLLVEFRTRLFADVVTGKLDVREVASKLPDEPAELQEPELELSDNLSDEEAVVE